MQKQAWPPYTALLTLLVLLLSTFASTAIIITTQNVSTTISPTTQNTTTGLTDNNIPSCIKAPKLFQRERRPLDLDCAVALNELNMIPVRPERGQFHMYGDFDGFRLPLTQHYGNCKVEVTLRERSEVDDTTWSAIRLAARSIRQECVEKGKGGKERTGGTVMAGFYDRIVVSLTKVKRIDILSFGNGSVGLGVGALGGNGTAIT